MKYVQEQAEKVIGLMGKASMKYDKKQLEELKTKLNHSLGFAIDDAKELARAYPSAEVRMLAERLTKILTEARNIYLELGTTDEK